MSAAARWSGALVGLFAALLPSLALACPSCASRDGGGVAYLVFLGTMILLPFAVAGVTGYVLVKGVSNSHSH